MSYFDYQHAAENMIALWHADPEAVIDAAREIGVKAEEAGEAFAELEAVLRSVEEGTQ